MFVPSPMVLSPRLQTVANFVPLECRFVDVGTDHGYLPLWLLQQKRIVSAIAADLNKGPLERARETSARYQIPLDLRLSDGLENILPSEVDVVAIAGMGGLTMVHILEQWTEKHPCLWDGRFLLQPMSTQYELRKWLVTHGFDIEQECTAKEEKQLYTIMVVKRGESSPYTEGELWVGKHSSKDPLRMEFLHHWIGKTQRALDKLPPHQEKRSQELQARLEEWNKMVQYKE